MTKIYYQGRRINGRFDSFKAAIKRLVRFTLRWSIISGVAYSLFMAGATLYSTHSIEASVIDNTPKKIAELKASVIDRLLACESAGHKEDDAIVMYDNNKAGTLTGKNVWSFGQLQWKVSTIQTFVKKRTGEVITQKEAVLLALDTERAKDLASWVIFETDGGIYHWKNCAEKHGLPAEVAIIKKLSK